MLKMPGAMLRHMLHARVSMPPRRYAACYHLRCYAFVEPPYAATWRLRTCQRVVLHAVTLIRGAASLPALQRHAPWRADYAYYAVAAAMPR